MEWPRGGGGGIGLVQFEPQTQAMTINVGSERDFDIGLRLMRGGR
jgi:hypothetical protein